MDKEIPQDNEIIYSTKIVVHHFTPFLVDILAWTAESIIPHINSKSQRSNILHRRISMPLESPATVTPFNTSMAAS